MEPAQEILVKQSLDMCVVSSSTKNNWHFWMPISMSTTSPYPMFPVALAC